MKLTPDQAKAVFRDNFCNTVDASLRRLHACQTYQSFSGGLRATTDLLKSYGLTIDESDDTWKPVNRDESGKYEIGVGLPEKKLFLSVYRGPAGEHEFYACLIGPEGVF